MKVAIDISATRSDHRFRGIGSYVQELTKELTHIANRNQSLELVTFASRVPTADLYHFPAFNPFFFSFPFNLIKKSIFTIHDLIPLEYPQHYPAGLKGSLRWMIQKHLLQSSLAIITDSVYSANSIQNLIEYPKERTHVVYLAPSEGFKEISKLERTEDALTRLKPPERFVLYVGDVNWNKNLMMLARVCVELEIPLVVVGKQAANLEIDRKHPWNRELVAFQDYARTHKEYIRCYGYVSQKDLVSLYNWAWCYVQPSIIEGFGLPVLEAMACGCLVLCADSSSLPEIAGDAALYFDPQDQISLKKQLQYVWDTRNSKKLAKYHELSLTQASKFTWVNAAKQTWDIYRHVLI